MTRHWYRAWWIERKLNFWDRERTRVTKNFREAVGTLYTTLGQDVDALLAHPAYSELLQRLELELQQISLVQKALRVEWSCLLEKGGDEGVRKA